MSFSMSGRCHATDQTRSCATHSGGFRNKPSRAVRARARNARAVCARFTKPHVLRMRTTRYACRLARVTRATENIKHKNENKKHALRAPVSHALRVPGSHVLRALRAHVLRVREKQNKYNKYDKANKNTTMKNQ